MIYGIFTNRGDGCTYGYSQLEFVTDDCTKPSVQEFLKDKLNLSEDEILELLTGWGNSISFDQDHYDKANHGFSSVYIEKLPII